MTRSQKMWRVECGEWGVPRTHTLHSPLSTPHSSRRHAFSLTEILIVIALIVLMLALALPAFNFITGGRSIDGAMNGVSAFLSRARTEAVGVQEMRGVMFYLDPKTEREMMVLVKEVPAPTTGGVNGNVEVWLDALDADHIPLPKGVGVELVNDNSANPTTSDVYLGFKQLLLSPAPLTPPVVVVPTSGVILFDAYGRLSSQRYGLKMQDNSTGTAQSTTMAKLIVSDADVTHYDNYPAASVTTNNVSLTSFAFVVFDHELFKDKNFKDEDPAPANSLLANWLNDNATGVTINRYNGTLVKGE